MSISSHREQENDDQRKNKSRGRPHSILFVLPYTQWHPQWRARYEPIATSLASRDFEVDIAWVEEADDYVKHPILFATRNLMYICAALVANTLAGKPTALAILSRIVKITPRHYDFVLSGGFAFKCAGLAIALGMVAKYVLAEVHDFPFLKTFHPTVMALDALVVTLWQKRMFERRLETIHLPLLPWKELDELSSIVGRDSLARHSGSPTFYYHFFRPIKYNPECSRRIFDAFRNVSSRARLILTGVADFEPALRSYASKIGIGSRVDFKGWLSKEGYGKMLLGVDVGIIYRPDTPYYNAGYPTKLIEYQACGIPIIATASGELGRIVKESQCGVLVEYGDIPKLTDAMDLLARDSVLRSKLGKNGRLYYEKSNDSTSLTNGFVRDLISLTHHPVRRRRAVMLTLILMYVASVFYFLDEHWNYYRYLGRRKTLE